MRIDVCVFVVQLWRCRLHVFATFTHTHKYLTSSHTAREALKIVIPILDKNLYIMVNNTRAAHTRLSSCKHTHSVQTLTAPRAFLPRERTRSLFFAGVWTQLSASLPLATSSTACNVPVQPVTIVNNEGVAYTRMPSCKHTHSAQSLTVTMAFLPRERAPSLACCGSLGSTLYIMVNNTRAAHTRLPSCKHTHSVQTLAAPRATHTRLPSCKHTTDTCRAKSDTHTTAIVKHTHSALTLTAPRVFLARERAPSLAAHTRLPSGKHTHSALALTAPRAFLLRERARSLVF